MSSVRMTQSAQRETVTSLTRDLLEWISSQPRTYTETMEAWRTSCPRLSIWEDALSAGFIQIRDSKVTLTARGREAIGTS